MVDVDFDEAGLLDGLEGRDREARIELLQRLRDDGATDQELIDAVNHDRLALLLVERRLGGRHTMREIEQATGLPADFLMRMRRLLGLPVPDLDDRVFSDEDVEQARSTKLFLDAGFDAEALAELSRVMGESMGRVAASVTAVVADTFLRAGDTESQVAERFDRLAEQLTPALAPVLMATFNAHLRESIHRARLQEEERRRGQLATETELVVCFADMVGFTRLGGELEVGELGTVARQLAELAADHARPPVRLIKSIGDAVMLVSPDAGPLVQAALELIDAAASADLPSLRAGVAAGPTGQRGGDYFGHSVNLASRVTGVARPGSVLATEPVREQASDSFDWSYAGRFRLKGVADSEPLYRAHLQVSSSSPKADRRRTRASR